MRLLREVNCENFVPCVSRPLTKIKMLGVFNGDHNSLQNKNVPVASGIPCSYPASNRRFRDGSLVETSTDICIDVALGTGDAILINWVSITRVW